MTFLHCFVFSLYFPIILCFDNKISKFLQMEYELDTFHEKSKVKNDPTGKVKTHYFDQLLDHYNYDTRKWKQQYFIVLPEQNIPTPNLAFICIGGEDNLTADGFCNKFLHELLSDYKNAIGFYVEHRFYGESQPTGDTSLKSLAYLNSRQALADLAYFVKKIVFEKYKIMRPPIILGCSYAGTLSTWFRKKYPHLSMGAVALSPPLKAKINFSDYYKIAYESGVKLDKECVEMLPDAAKELYQTAMNDKDSFEEKLGLCKTILRNSNKTYPEIADSVWLSVTKNFFIFAQYGVPQAVRPMCRKLKVQGIFAVAKSIVESYGPPAQKREELCVDPFLIQHQWIKNKEEQDAELGVRTGKSYLRPWQWQKCSEFGWFKTNSTTKNVFLSFSLKEFLDVCQGIYLINRKELENSIERTNVEFGAYDVTDLSRLLVINGEYDPWKGVSLPEHQGSYEDVVSLVIPKGHHCPVKTPETYKRIKEAVKVWMEKS